MQVDRVDLSRLSPHERDQLLELLQEQVFRSQGRKFYEMFPDTGPYRRELYPRHLELFRVGATYPERCFMAANRVGKTVAGGYEVTSHLTGDYPKWWEGRTFRDATRCWAAGKTNETTRDIIQKKMFGEPKWYGKKKGLSGTGIVPRDAIIQESITWKSGVPDLIDTVRIKHVTGDESELGLKSYEQGRGAFEGTERHVIWFDEECPLDVYGEALIRTATTGGIILITFTPLDGISDTVMEFVPELKRKVAEGDDA